MSSSPAEPKGDLRIVDCGVRCGDSDKKPAVAASKCSFAGHLPSLQVSDAHLLTKLERGLLSLFNDIFGKHAVVALPGQ
jgi:hypothetical protein